MFDFLLWVGFVWGLAITLNKTVFNSQSASKGMAWGATFCVFVVSVFALSFFRFLQYKGISDAIGFNIGPKNGIDVAGAFISAWIFYGILNRGFSGSEQVQPGIRTKKTVAAIPFEREWCKR